MIYSLAIIYHADNRDKTDYLAPLQLVTSKDPMTCHLLSLCIFLIAYQSSNSFMLRSVSIQGQKDFFGGRISSHRVYVLTFIFFFQLNHLFNLTFILKDWSYKCYIYQLP